MKKQFKAILFDMDGTLIDSMKYHVIAWTSAFKEHGYYPGELVFYLNEGVKHPITVRDRLRKLGVENPDEELVKQIYTRKRAIFDEIVDIKPTDGAIELLNLLKGKVKLGVVTAGLRPVIERVISQLFEGIFDFIVDNDSTEKGKPDPDPFLHGAKLTGLPNENILVVENAPTGIESAKGAGLTCWALCTTLEPKYLDRADKIFADFKALQATLFNDNCILS
ncbi:MAG: HAD family phosphatase [candidate division Zixibacteria bacterium]|nr:HAD family phosphatase [candidate division Zixibacteria bacterium]